MCYYNVVANEDFVCGHMETPFPLTKEQEQLMKFKLVRAEKPKDNRGRKPGVKNKPKPPPVPTPEEVPSETLPPTTQAPTSSKLAQASETKFIGKSPKAQPPPTPTPIPAPKPKPVKKVKPKRKRVVEEEEEDYESQ
jgi:hypothetical protein